MNDSDTVSPDSRAGARSEDTVNRDLSAESNDSADAPGDTVDTNLEDEATDHESDETAGKEARRYRLRLRETETERDQLAARIETMQRAEAERLAATTLAKGEALWVGGATIADLCNDDGDLDADKITAVATEIREQYGIPKPTSGLYVPAEGGNPGARPTDSMVDVVQGRTR